MRVEQPGESVHIHSHFLELGLVHCRVIRCVVLLSIIYGTHRIIITYKFNTIVKLESVRPQSGDNSVDKKKVI